jgi:hypothetical protein
LITLHVHLVGKIGTDLGLRILEALEDLLANRRILSGNEFLQVDPESTQGAVNVLCQLTVIRGDRGNLGINRLLNCLRDVLNGLFGLRQTGLNLLRTSRIRTERCRLSANAQEHAQEVAQIAPRLLGGCESSHHGWIVNRVIRYQDAVS